MIWIFFMVRVDQQIDIRHDHVAPFVLKFSSSAFAKDFLQVVWTDTGDVPAAVGCYLKWRQVGSSDSRSSSSCLIRCRKSVRCCSRKRVCARSKSSLAAASCRRKSLCCSSIDVGFGKTGIESYCRITVRNSFFVPAKCILGSASIGVGFNKIGT